MMMNRAERPHVAYMQWDIAPCGSIKGPNRFSQSALLFIFANVLQQPVGHSSIPLHPLSPLTLDPIHHLHSGGGGWRRRTIHRPRSVKWHFSPRVIITSTISYSVCGNCGEDSTTTMVTHPHLIEREAPSLSVCFLGIIISRP